MRASEAIGKQGEVTLLLRSWSQGDDGARDRAMKLLYDELHVRARGLLYGTFTSDSLDATALVHESYLRLIAQVPGGWQNRSHFLAIAATMMRRIIVDHARGRDAEKRGGGWQRVTLDLSLADAEATGVDVLSLNEALGALASFDEVQARIVECRFFGGLSVEDTAEALEISPATVKREWRMARAWLYKELFGPALDSGRRGG